MENWIRIWAVKSLPEASIIKGMLEENNIPAFILNKQDSSYLNFGEIELHVPAHLKDIALQLVSKTLMN